MPRLGKVKAHRDYHQARIQSIPAIWKPLTSSLQVQDMEPVNLQAVNVSSGPLHEGAVQDATVELWNLTGGLFVVNDTT